MAILLLDKWDFTEKNITGDKEGHFIMGKWSVNPDFRFQRT